MRYNVYSPCKVHVCMMLIPLFQFNVEIFVNKSYMGVHVIGNEKFAGGQFVMLGYKLYFQPRLGTIFFIENTKYMTFHNWHKWGCNTICMCFLCFKKNICRIFKMSKRSKGLLSGC
jgi:hypothetical protein